MSPIKVINDSKMSLLLEEKLKSYKNNINLQTNNISKVNIRMDEVAFLGNKKNGSEISERRIPNRT